ncbi:hypothetical protein SDC9_163600 [bioreactor metagenome]|uniref:Uncharacterized protein n=1 Tax=bioreactor metagenome TaxID=1076179 RepID=A0A645FRL8_9ZZZZ
MLLSLVPVTFAPRIIIQSYFGVSFINSLSYNSVSGEILPYEIICGAEDETTITFIKAADKAVSTTAPAKIAAILNNTGRFFLVEPFEIMYFRIIASEYTNQSIKYYVLS